jgi:hypothetical protein
MVESYTDCVTFHFIVTRDGNSCPLVERTVSAAGEVTVVYLQSLTDGSYTVAATATDAAGNKQVTAATFDWTVVLPVQLLAVNITAGPPELYALPEATVEFYADYQEGGRVMLTDTVFEVKLNDGPWSMTPHSLRCDGAAGLCNYTLATEVAMSYTLQVS